MFSVLWLFPHPFVFVTHLWIRGMCVCVCVYIYIYIYIYIYDVCTYVCIMYVSMYRSTY